MLAAERIGDALPTCVRVASAYLGIEDPNTIVRPRNGLTDEFGVVSLKPVPKPRDLSGIGDRAGTLG